MNTIEAQLKSLCLESPHWMQLELQAFWYGLLSHTLDAAENNVDLSHLQLTAEQVLLHADPAFEGWPTDWLEPYVLQFLELRLSFDEQQTFFEHLETLFQDTVPVDLQIFTVLSEGETLTEDQWVRLMDTLAFQPPSPMVSSKGFAKTRRTHGRRGITPLKRRRVRTLHKKPTSTIHCLKVQR